MNQQLLQLVKETFLGGDFEDNFVLQDFILPIKHIKAAVEFNHEVTGIYPLWMEPAALDSEKGNGRVRPVGVEPSLVRALHKESNRVNKPVLAEFLEPQQFAMSVGGAAKLVNSVRMW